VLLSIALLLPDFIYYVLWQPSLFDLSYSGRHLLNPFRSLANWPLVEAHHGLAIPFLVGLTGLLAYLVLIHLGIRMTVQPDSIDTHRSTAAAVEPGSANVIY
jgi:hypothetical protein